MTLPAPALFLAEAVGLPTIGSFELMIVLFTVVLSAGLVAGFIALVRVFLKIFPGGH